MDPPAAYRAIFSRPGSKSAVGQGTYRGTQEIVHRSTACKTYFQRAEVMAEAAGVTEVSCLHLLAAILDTPGLADRLLQVLKGHAV